MIARLVRLVALWTALASTAPAQEAVLDVGTGPEGFTIRSTTDIGIIRPALQAFARANPGLTVHYEQWGSNPLYAGALAACQGTGAPVDAVFSSAVHQMVALVNRACAQSYSSPLTEALPATRRWRDEIWGITQEPAVIIYNTRLLAPEDVPLTRFALLDLMRSKSGELRSRIATYDIEESGLGYLFAYADSLEATTFGALLEGFARTESIATCCSAEIIAGVSQGRYAMAYNVLGSYVANARPPDVGIVLPEDYTLFLSRAYVIPRGARNPGAARRFLDFLLSPEGQVLLAEVGLIHSQDPAEIGLRQSARRAIALAPPLLVPLDRNTKQQFFQIWNEALSVAPDP